MPVAPSSSALTTDTLLAWWHPEATTEPVQKGGRLPSVLAAMWQSSLSALSAALLLAATAAQSVYPIDWTSVPSSANAAATVDAPCQCNLTVARCDANCFCDTECTSAQRARFSGVAAAGRPSVDVFMCVDPSLVSVNDRGEVTSAIVDNLLCITKHNNPSQGDFFDDPGTASAPHARMHSGCAAPALRLCRLSHVVGCVVEVRGRR